MVATSKEDIAIDEDDSHLDGGYSYIDEDDSHLDGGYSYTIPG